MARSTRSRLPMARSPGNRRWGMPSQRSRLANRTSMGPATALTPYDPAHRLPPANSLPIIPRACLACLLQTVSNRAKDVADLWTHQHKNSDDHDSNQRDDERILDQPLTTLCTFSLP